MSNSASGYYEVLCLLLEKFQEPESILVLDEPALRLHPNKIKYLSRILSGSERQIILVTHSPYFVDASLFFSGRKLVYMNRHDSRSSKAFTRTTKDSESNTLGIKSYIFNSKILFSSCNILVEGAGDAATFYAISDALNSIFERYNITVVEAGGHGHIDHYVNFMTDFGIPYIAMVDKQYCGINRLTDKFVILDGKLEDELAILGWTGNIEKSIDPDKAYDFVFDIFQKGGQQNIRNTKIAKVFDEVLKRIGETPDMIWAQPGKK